MAQGKGHPAEVALICAAAFGLPVLTSLTGVLDPEPPASLDAAALWSLAIFECGVGCVLWRILRRRGWTTGELGLHWRTGDLPATVGVAIACYCGAWILFVIAEASGIGLPDPDRAMPITHGLGFGSILAVSLVNPVFEEVFVCGYLVGALARSGRPWLAINASVALRLTYHLYQGANGVVGIVPMGLIAALWFVRTRRLWPVVLAHAVLDFVALLPYA